MTLIEVALGAAIIGLLCFSIGYFVGFVSGWSYRGRQ
jgi:uncharacterized membrane protein SpoIIM required for sporulation